MSKHHIYNRLSFLISSVFSCLFGFCNGPRARNRLLRSEGIGSFRRYFASTIVAPIDGGNILSPLLVFDD